MGKQESEDLMDLGSILFVVGLICIFVGLGYYLFMLLIKIFNISFFAFIAVCGLIMIIAGVFIYLIGEGMR